MCRTRNQFVLHDAKFLHERLRRTSTLFPLAEKRFFSLFKEKTVALVEMGEELEQHARFHSRDDRLQRRTETDQRHRLSCANAER